MNFLESAYGIRLLCSRKFDALVKPEDMTLR